jgi:hydrogenase-4 component B
MNGELMATFPAMLIMGAALTAAFSGAPLLVRFLNPTFGQRLATLAMVVAALGGLVGALMTLINHQHVIYQLAWPFPFGPAECGIDPLSAFFALPILIVAACCSIYALDYWPALSNPRTYEN